MDKYMKELIREYVDTLEFISVFDKLKLEKAIQRYVYNTEHLYSVYKVLHKISNDDENEGLKELNFLTDENETINVIKKDNKYILILPETEVEIDRQKIIKLLIDIIDICHEILPLGTVVSLNEMYMSEFVEKTNLKDIKIVITNRYLNYTKYSYFEYAGVFYPVGEYKINQKFHFTSGLIKKVLSKGYSDEEEKKYNYLMKYEFKIKNNIRSIGFADKFEKERMNKKVKELCDGKL